MVYSIQSKNQNILDRLKLTFPQEITSYPNESEMHISIFTEIHWLAQKGTKIYLDHIFCHNTTSLAQWNSMSEPTIFLQEINHNFKQFWKRYSLNLAIYILYPNWIRYELFNKKKLEQRNTTTQKIFKHSRIDFFQEIQITFDHVGQDGL